MDEVAAMRLQVQAFAGGIITEEDTDGLLLRVGIEGSLDGLATLVGRRPLVDLDAG